ncbi:MAG: ion channel [Chloroflexota bacterium]
MRNSGSLLRRFWHFLQRENFHRMLISILVLLIASAVGIAALEPDITLANGMWWSIVTLTTVGYGDISPVTMGGRLIAVALMLIGIGVLGTLSASIAGFLIEKRLKEDRGLADFDFEGHIIICEWNYRARVVLDEFRADSSMKEAPIVLIADLENKPIDDDFLFFVHGTTTDEALIQANLPKAKTVIILGDDKLEPTARDAKVVLTTLTAESINPNTYTIVELMDDANVRHCKRAQADEIIIGSELSSNLIARAALNHGITKVVSEVLTATGGNELFKIPTPANLIGQAYIDAYIAMKKNFDSIVLAIQRGVDGDVISNPPQDHQLQADDYLIVIAEKKPQY